MPIGSFKARIYEPKPVGPAPSGPVLVLGLDHDPQNLEPGPLNPDSRNIIYTDHCDFIFCLYFIRAGIERKRSTSEKYYRTKNESDKRYVQQFCHRSTSGTDSCSKLFHRRLDILIHLRSSFESKNYSMNIVFSTRDRQGRSKRIFPMKFEYPRGRALPDTLAGLAKHMNWPAEVGGPWIPNHWVSPSLGLVTGVNSRTLTSLTPSSHWVYEYWILNV